MMLFNLIPYDNDIWKVAADFYEEEGFLVLPAALRQKVYPFDYKEINTRNEGPGEGSCRGHSDAFGYSRGNGFGYYSFDAGDGRGNGYSQGSITSGFGDEYGDGSGRGDGKGDGDGFGIMNEPIFNRTNL